MTRLGNTTRAVRDTLFEHKDDGWYTVQDATDQVKADRGLTTSTGAIRRSLNELAKESLLDQDTSSSPQRWQWNPNAAQPTGWRPAKNKTASKASGSTATATSSVPTTQDARRNELQNRLSARMDVLKGRKSEPGKEDAKKPRRKKLRNLDIKRRNGQIYRQRELAGKPDVETLRILRENKIYPLLSGPPGTGKTVLADAAFGTEPGGLYVITGDENTGVEDFVGGWSPTGRVGEYVWVNGPLIEAMNEGGVLFVDDATLINPKVLAVVYPVMDGREEITVKEHVVCRKCEHRMHEEACPCGCTEGSYGRAAVVRSQPGFFVVAAHNPGVHGAILTDALSSRFIAEIWVETDLELAASLGTPEKLIKAIKNLRTEREKSGDYGMWIPQLRECLAYRDIATVFGEETAARNLIGKAPEEDRPNLINKLRISFGTDLDRLELGGQL